MNRASLLLILVAAAGGCDDRGGGSGADAGSRADSGPQECTVPDTACPEDQPIAGQACDTAETCTYPDPGGMYTWTLRCTSGAWEGTSDCVPPPGGACPVGPLAESCRPAFTGTLTGATVEIGPPGGAFRPFLADERVGLIIGGQGAPMVSYRFRVTGEGLPSCVTASSTLSIDGMATPPASQRVALHCGETSAVFQIVAQTCDAPAEHVLGIRVQVAGIGTGTATVRYTEPGCTG